MSSLRDALKKAGFEEKEQKSPNEGQKKHRSSGNKPAPKKQQHFSSKKHDHHYKTQNFCSGCRKTLPDVELYGSPRGKRDRWLCVGCADEQMILDEHRKTAQSDFSNRKMFRRQYGRTTPPHIVKKKQDLAKEQQNKDKEEQKKTRRFNSNANKGYKR